MSEWKETDLGRIPINWEIGTLGEICSFLTDGSHYSPKPTQSEYFMASVKDMRYNYFDFSDCKTISENDFKALVENKCSPKQGDVLLSKDGANCLDLIFVYKQSQKIVLLSSIAIARLKEGYDPDFYRYFLLSPTAQSTMRNNYVSGSAIPRVVLKDFKNVPIPIIEYKDQKSIASILSSLDDKIDLLHRQNSTLEKMAETLFRQWFVEEAKEDWEMGPLGGFVNIAYGKNLPTKNLLPSGYPVFGGNGQIGFFDKYIYQEPQILVSCRGEASGVVNISLKNSFVTNNSLILEIGKRPEITFEFLKYSSLNTDFKTYVSGSAQPQITIEGLYPAEFVLPPKDLISKFTEIVRQWELKRTNNQTQIRTLTTLRDTLLPKLMSGEVRVKID